MPQIYPILALILHLALEPFAIFLHQHWLVGQCTVGLLGFFIFSSTVSMQLRYWDGAPRKPTVYSLCWYVDFPITWLFMNQCWKMLNCIIDNIADDRNVSLLTCYILCTFQEWFVPGWKYLDVEERNANTKPSKSDGSGDITRPAKRETDQLVSKAWEPWEASSSVVSTTSETWKDYSTLCS